MRSFYCQLDYESVPYLSSQGAADGNIANNGCGVCSCSMVAENLAGVSLPPEECAALSKASGAREGFGTNLFVFAPYFAQYAGLDYQIAWEPEEALRFLQEKKGMVVANTQGDRPKDGYIGVFSDSGHYIVLAAAEGSTVKVWDPMYRIGSGRYDTPGRKGKVRLDGNEAYADFSVIEQDCKDRPYFLFSKAEKPLPRPLIGVISCVRDEGKTQYVYRKYMQAVQDAGGMPVLLSIDPPEETMQELLSRMDGLLLAGGHDIDPACYGQTPIPELGAVSHERDASEFPMIRLFREMNKPILGICRGIQAMAVAFGGTLYQDLPTQKPSGTDHYPDKEGWSIREAHSVSVVRGTRLEAIAGGGEWPVNSYHHQAVKTLPEGARLAALAPDGVIEAFEMPEGALCLGVQWHPERTCDTDAHAFSLFKALVYSARAGMIDLGEGKK